MQTIGIKDYDAIRGSTKIRTPSFVRHPLGRISLNGTYKKLGDAEKLAVFLLAELAIEYDNEIPWDCDVLKSRMGIASDIDWKSLFGAGEIYFNDGSAKNDINQMLDERMVVVKANWNKVAAVSPLTEITRIIRGQSTYRSLRARCRDKVFWAKHTDALDMAVRSAFLCGEPGRDGRTFKIHFKWFVDKGHFEKIISGMYTNGRGKTIWISRRGKTQYEIPSKVTSLDVVIDAYQGDR